MYILQGNVLEVSKTKTTYLHQNVHVIGERVKRARHNDYKFENCVLYICVCTSHFSLLTFHGIEWLTSTTSVNPTCKFGNPSFECQPFLNIAITKNWLKNKYLGKQVSFILVFCFLTMVLLQ